MNAIKRPSQQGGDGWYAEIIFGPFMSEHDADEFSGGLAMDYNESPEPALGISVNDTIASTDQVRQ